MGLWGNFATLCARISYATDYVVGEVSFLPTTYQIGYQDPLIPGDYPHVIAVLPKLGFPFPYGWDVLPDHV